MARALTEIPEAEPRSITARVLAPLALIACVLVLILLVSGTLSSDGDGRGGGPREGQRTEKQRDRPELRGETYVVAPGDTLSAIAARARVPQAKLERLNPGIDSATLVAGQEIRLRR